MAAGVRGVETAGCILSLTDRLDILINNAGIIATPEGVTHDGYEIQFGANHLGQALLIKLLLPTLELPLPLARLA